MAKDVGKINFPVIGSGVFMIDSIKSMYYNIIVRKLFVGDKE